MQFLITPNSDFSNKAILTDDYTPEEIKKGVHFKNIREDLKHLNFGNNVRIYSIVREEISHDYTLLSS